MCPVVVEVAGDLVFFLGVLKGLEDLVFFFSSVRGYEDLFLAL